MIDRMEWLYELTISVARQYGAAPKSLIHIDASRCKAASARGLQCRVIQGGSRVTQTIHAQGLGEI